MKRHNAGESLSTKSGVPWKLLHTIICDCKSDAILLETKIKKRGIVRYLSQNNIDMLS